ncbi:MAG: hypothetical protein JW768_03525 [Chitinispirillaceae bacterium]|nr:hypothetical protein [Chitinispirillaceae bacterium]
MKPIIYQSNIIHFVCAFMCMLVFALPRFSSATYIEGHDSVSVGSWFSFITKSESDSANGNFRVIASSDILGVIGTVYLNEKGRWAGSYDFNGVRESPDDTSSWGWGLVLTPLPYNCNDDSCHCMNSSPVIVSVKEGKFSKLKLTCFRDGFVFFDWGYQDDSTRLFYNTNSIKNRLRQRIFNNTPSTEKEIYDLKGRKINWCNNYDFLPSGIYLIRNRKNSCISVKLVNNFR